MRMCDVGDGEAGAGQAAMRLCGAEKRNKPGLARSAHQQHSWRVCPSAARKRVASYATGKVVSIAGQSAQPTAAPKRRGLPCTGFAVTDIAHAHSGP